MKYWLMKSEPNEFSIDDLMKRPNQTEPWDGVRNYQARNMMRDEMKLGDQLFFYHSNCQTPGIVGMANIVKEAYPDDNAFDPKDKHYDSKSDPAKPRWFKVEVKFLHKLKDTLSLNELKKHPELENLALVRRGNRLSIMPVDEKQWHFILGLIQKLGL